jgi:hypothetical protein
MPVAPGWAPRAPIGVRDPDAGFPNSGQSSFAIACLRYRSDFLAYRGEDDELGLVFDLGNVAKENLKRLGGLRELPDFLIAFR